jgi:hypothetical protein
VKRVPGCLALILVLVAACQPTQPDTAGSPFEFVDLTDEYTRFWDRTQSMDERTRVAAFKEEFGRVSVFYDTSRFADTPPEVVDQRIAGSFARFPEIRAKYTRIAVSFDGMIRPAIDAFRRAFPDLEIKTPVYLLHSLGEMDGGTRTLGGREVLIFGADVMASVHTFDDETPFLHHELFHVHHQRFFPECDKVWCALWTEGLAVYVAQQLNPSASDDQLLLTEPEPIRAQVDAHLAEAVCAARSRLDSNASDDLRALFSFKRLSSAVPPRAGYYIGYLAVRSAGAARSIDQLARLPPAEVRPLLEKQLAELANCSRFAKLTGSAFRGDTPAMTRTHESSTLRWWWRHS